MYLEAIILIGAAILIYSFGRSMSLVRSITDRTLRRWWALLLILICFFLVGYLTTVAQSMNNQVEMTPLVSFVLLFGSIFVVIIVTTLNSFTNMISKGKERIDEFEKALEKRAKELSEFGDKLQESNKELEKKKKELDDLNRLTIGRELDMIELKKKIKALEGRKDA